MRVLLLSHVLGTCNYSLATAALVFSCSDLVDHTREIFALTCIVHSKENYRRVFEAENTFRHCLRMFFGFHILS
jgi:hypothetical protein